MRYLIAFLVAAPLVCAQKPKASARDLYLETGTAGAQAPLGLRVSILKREAAGHRQVDPDTVFRSGDGIRVAVESNQAGYLYIVLQGSSGNWSLLFPSAQIAGGSNVMQSGARYTIPSSGDFRFDTHPGQERIFVLLTRQPEQDLEQLIYSLAPTPSAQPQPQQPPVIQAKLLINDELVRSLRGQVQSRDLVLEKAGAPSAGPAPAQPAMYVVNSSATAGDRVVFDLVLRHE